MKYRLIIASICILGMSYVHCMSHSTTNTTHNQELQALIDTQARQLHQTAQQEQQRILYPALYQVLEQPTQTATYQAPTNTINISDIHQRLEEAKKQLVKTKKHKKKAWSSAKGCLYKAGAFGLVACLSHAFEQKFEQDNVEKRASKYSSELAGYRYIGDAFRLKQLQTQIWLAFLSSKISLFIGSVQGVLGFKHLFHYFRAKKTCLQLKVNIKQYKQALKKHQKSVFPDLEQIFG